MPQLLFIGNRGGPDNIVGSLRPWRCESISVGHVLDFLHSDVKMSLRRSMLLAIAASTWAFDASVAADRGQYSDVDPSVKACVKSLQTEASGVRGCCEESDGYPVEAEDWHQQPDGTYRVKITIDGDADWHPVPGNAVLKPGACGLRYAIVWWYRLNALDRSGAAKPVIQCFIPGTTS